MSPWCRQEKIVALYSSTQGSRSTTDYDYSASMTGPNSHLRDIVYDLLSKTHKGELIRAEFRLVAESEILVWGETFDGVHLIPKLDEGLRGPAVKLAKTLRPDQESALQFVVESERVPKLQRCNFRAFARMPQPPLVEGGYACLKPSFSPNALGLESKAVFNRQCREQLSQVLADSGRIIGIANPEMGGGGMVTLSWSHPSDKAKSLNLTMHCRHVEAQSLPGRLSPGGHVRLLRPDHFWQIGAEDVGILMRRTDQQVEVCFPQCSRWRGEEKDLVVTSAVAKCGVEVRLCVEYRIFGSICGQKMGWGKTPLMVALIKHMSEASGERSTSLVIVPPKLFRQWVNELQSWLGLPPGTGAWMTTPDGALSVWAPVDMAAFKEDPEVAATADVVVLPHTIFASKKYPCDSEAWPESLFNVQGRRWSRLILDEVHEISSFSREIQRRMLAVQCHASHLLSGTPEQGGGSRGAASLALAFKASLCPMTHSQFSFDADPNVTLAASQFFQTFARTQNSPFKLPVAERVVAVQLSDAEKVLYANLKDHGAPTTRDLLELCCCFLSEDSSSANKEIGVLIKQKKRDFEAKLGAARGHAAFLLLLAEAVSEGVRLAARRQRLKGPSERKEYWEEGRRIVEGVFAELEPLSSEHWVDLVRKEHVHGVKARDLIACETEADLKPNLRNLPNIYQRAEVKAAFSDQLDNHLSHDFLSLGALKKPLDFLEKSMRELAGGGSCPICLDGLANGEATCMTSCGHAFHEDCIAGSRKARPDCPNCRQHVMEVYATRPLVPVDPYSKYGTKVKVMIATLKEIQRDFPGERLLLFVQYRNMRKKLEQAFREFEVPFLTLSGSARVQGNAIIDWQNKQNLEDFIMMLSCEEHNSGITLTAARLGAACFRGGVRVWVGLNFCTAGTSCWRTPSMLSPTRRPRPWSNRRWGALTASGSRPSPWSSGGSLPRTPSSRSCTRPWRVR